MPRHAMLLRAYEKKRREGRFSHLLILRIP
jgi:hypothetical protein